jgi:hypothetical protein
MRRSLKIALCFPLAFAHWSAHAQIYMCKDASGRTITSDRPIPECADRAVRELDKSGKTRREIPPPMTAEQKRELQLQQEKHKAEEAAADELKRSDRLLRARYRDEGDIETARKRALEIVEEQIKREKVTLAAAEKQQQQAQAEADSLRKKNTALSAALQHRLDDSAQSVGGSKKALQEYEAELGLINAKHDAALKRYRELATASAAK